jgi:hypothetical protein
MSPQAGLILIDEIIPRLRSTVPRCVQPVGSEDAEELLQDSIAVAAQMLHNIERSGREVLPAVIACCALLLPNRAGGAIIAVRPMPWRLSHRGRAIAVVLAGGAESSIRDGRAHVIGRVAG